MTQMRRSKTHKGVFRTCDCRRTDCGHWRYQVELPSADGQRRQRYGSKFATARAAAEERAEMVRAARRDELPRDNKTTFGQWLDKWLTERIAAEEIRPSTARSYTDLANRYLKPRLGHTTLAKLRAHHFSTAYREILAERRAAIADAQAERDIGRHVVMPRSINPTTIRRIHAVASRALSSAVSGGLIPQNPASNAELPKAAKSKVQPWTPEQYVYFLRKTEDERLHIAYWLLGHTGLRRGELAGLTWDDIDLTAGKISVTRARVSVGFEVLDSQTKSDAGQRVIKLDAGTVERLKAWRKRQLEERLTAGTAYNDQGFVLSNELGEPVHPELISKTFRRLAGKHGLPVIKLHALRHQYATALKAAGVKIDVASKLLGHSSITVTNDIYGHLWDDTAEEANEGVAAVYRDAR